MKAHPTEEINRKEELFHLLFSIQTRLDQFSSEHGEYRSDLIKVNKSIDRLIQKMIEECEESHFE